MRKFIICILAASVLLSVSVLASDKKQNPGEIQRRLDEIRAKKKARIASLMPKVKSLLNYDIELLQIALMIKVQEKYQGAVVLSHNSLAKETKYLGKIEDQFNAESIFNEFGIYGSKFSSDSIWNEFGNYGSQFSSESAFNEFTSNPPVIVKNNIIIGYLTMNKFIQGGIDPKWLKYLFVY